MAIHFHSIVAVTIIFIPSGARIGLEETSFRVMEDVGMIELCAIVVTPDIECPVKFTFNIHLYTVDGTASKVYCTYVK